LFVAGAVAFAAAAMVLSSTFKWPDILREPASVVLPAFAGGGTSLVWTWFATAWTYAILAVPILLLPAVLGRRDDPALWAATYVGVTSVVLSLIGFLRWVFVVPPLARFYVTGDAATRAAADAEWTAQHQYGGALLGEHLGQLLVIGWSVTVCVIIVRTRVLPRWLGVTGLAVSALYLLNQGDILATAVPGFPVWDLAGPIGSTGWGIWVAALGVTILLRPAPAASGDRGPWPCAGGRAALAFLLHAFGLDDPGLRDSLNESPGQLRPGPPGHLSRLRCPSQSPGHAAAGAAARADDHGFAPEPPVYCSESRAARRTYAGVAVPSSAHR
jgi:hypothetical protein